MFMLSCHGRLHRSSNRERATRTEFAEKPRDQRGPSGLMAGTASPAVVSMEVLTKEDEVAPMRVCGKARLLAVARAVTAVVGKKQPNQAPGKLGRSLSEIHSDAGADRYLHGKTVTIKVVV